MAENLEIFDMRVEPACTHLIVGPSGSGKTVLVANMIRNKDSFIKNGHNIKNIVFCYSAWQDLYSEMDKEGLISQWVNAVPNNEQFRELVGGFKDNGGSIIIFDDSMSAISRDMVEIVTVTSRHLNTSTFILFQSLFPTNPLAREISLNVKFMYLFKHPREKIQVNYIARQLNPLSYKWIVAAYHEATKKPHGYLMIDLTQNTPDRLRIRSSVLPHEFPMVIWNERKQ